MNSIGVVRSRLTAKADAPRQGSEGAPEAWIDIDPLYSDAIAGIVSGDWILLLTWLHLGDRSVLKTRPRDDPEKPLIGVFATRSPDRPNPIGLHRVRVLEVAPPARLRVHPLEAIDGTLILDIKPVLHENEQ